MLRRLNGLGCSGRTVANYSEKEYSYSFQCAAVQKIHPLRNLSKGTDRLLITPHLLVLSDHGTHYLNSERQLPQEAEGEDHLFADRLLPTLKYLYYQRQEHYFQDLFKLVADALASNREIGSATLTLAAVHPRSGQLRFYYIGDSLYGLFQDRNVVMVQPLCESFHRPLKLGQVYSPQQGYCQAYSHQQVQPDDVLVLGSNGLWNNVHLDLLHYHIRGPGSFEQEGKHSEAVGATPKENKSLQRIAEKVATIAAIFAKRGNYESPLFLQAQREKLECRREGFLDDVSVLLARKKRHAVIKRETQPDQPQ